VLADRLKGKRCQWGNAWS